MVGLLLGSARKERKVSGLLQASELVSVSQCLSVSVSQCLSLSVSRLGIHDVVDLLLCSHQ